MILRIYIHIYIYKHTVIQVNLFAWVFDNLFVCVHYFLLFGMSVPFHMLGGLFFECVCLF